MTTVHFRDGEARHTLRSEADTIDVTMLGGNWKYDPNWEFVDKAGHLHWAHGDPAVFPTLLTIVDKVWYADDGDGRQDEMIDSHLACTICYEPIDPGRVSAPSYILAMQRWYLDEVEITGAQAKDLLERHSEGRQEAQAH